MSIASAPCLHVFKPSGAAYSPHLKSYVAPLGLGMQLWNGVRYRQVAPPELACSPTVDIGGARKRRRQLIRFGIHPKEVFKATRGHRGYWWMAGSELVQRALDNRWLEERGVPSLKEQWFQTHDGQRNENFNPEAVNLTGTAGCGPACQAVWPPGG